MRDKDKGLFAISVLDFLPALVFFICLYGAITIEPEMCPDEAERQLLSEFIYKNGRLPTGNEPETMIEGWGFSYALRPYLSSIISAFFMKLADFVTSSEQVLLVMSRMSSVLSITGLCYVCQKTGKLIFHHESSSLLLSVIACFFPQVIFLGMYQNNDALSLFGVSLVLYFWVRGYQEHWTIKNCIRLAVAFSICILSYYVVYPCVLMGGLFFVLSCICDSTIENKVGFIGKRVGIMVGVVLGLTGWFFVRNAVLHQGDFIGLLTESISREQFEAQGVTLYEYKSSFQAGKNFFEFFSDKNFEWIRFTIRSVIGYFGHMLYPLPMVLYREYYAYIGTVILLFLWKWKHTDKSLFFHFFFGMLLSSGVMVTGLSLIQSYFRDYEPQGRYIITVILVFGWMSAYVADHSSVQKKKTEWLQSGAMIVFWMLLFAQAWFGTMNVEVLGK